MKELFEPDIDMLIPPNPKLYKHSALRLDKFRPTWAVKGWFCSSPFLPCLYLKPVTSSKHHYACS